MPEFSTWPPQKNVKRPIPTGKMFATHTTENDQIF